MWDKIVTIGIVVGAVLAAAYMVYRAVSGKSGCAGCGAADRCTLRENRTAKDRTKDQ